MSFALLTRLPAARAHQWQRLLSEELDGAPVLLGPPHGTPEEAARKQVEVLFVADPAPGTFGDWPAARFVQCLWAGVDGLLADSSLPPALPLARMKDPAFAATMGETVATLVLSLHRQLHRYRAQAAIGLWRPLEQPRAGERPVGILGTGEMGRQAARTLLALGFQVAGWSRHGQPVQGVTIHQGEPGLAAILAQSEILVNLLPLTAATHALLDRKRLAQMPRGASLVNLGRGEHVVLPDLLAALDAGHLDHAVLDVFPDEPLPDDHPLWRHPGVTVLPHVAAVTDPRSAAPIAAANARSFLAGQPVDALVDRQLGY
ncbi:MAG TPA: glyoxylate/hydroxypyruvate reductase A [Geminicoccus sp.]|jgi:glyoxylate/hydroxypyruvate reductase A|uniref:2-hydroxyacid dehydrogenase n=1 Tax=Geminicoccus sp. TaxID=2024832 RepID=UPI002E372E0F|nr:glyoxylate/hydroxypyruvate reductase A [Geminicoccus sp.]HEX2525097.1 glyoxylate/hydroxypyruvate reductase A [Geminicoccus sp.]